ncbi:MAG: DNA-binding response regulator [Planctomycetota bacterium]|nr:DNA-binding response regulator [Planctomycetota bacterium]GIK52209.1 MAG: DNA-binding response regulator [Planctomycetota bacterium]
MNTPPPKRRSVLVIEDEADIVEVIKYNLNKNGFETLTADSGEQGLEVAAARLPDLILLDLMLPRMDGLEVCRRLRGSERTRNIPIVMLTAKGTEADIVLGLTLGADDYVPKPFSPVELLARMKAVLRRNDSARKDDSNSDILKLGPITLDAARHEVSVDGEQVQLTLSEFKLLRHLMLRRGRVFTRDQLLNAVVGPDVFVTERNIDVHVGALRRKLGDAGQLILTVRGVGYRMEEP